MWKFGGSRLADIAYRSGAGIPSISTIRRLTAPPIIHPSPRTPTVAELQENLKAVLPSPPSGSRIVGANIMIDKGAIEKRLRLDPSTNEIIGLCREHSDHYTLEFNSQEEATLISNGLKQGDVHLASEATVIALGAFSKHGREYSSRVIAASGTCKREDATTHRAMLERVVETSREALKDVKHRVYCVSSDGEARRGRALAEMTLKHELPSTSPIHVELKGLRLFNRLVGDDDLTSDKDYKHIIKRFPSALMRLAGMCIDGTILTTSIIKQHLVHEGMDKRTADALLNPADKQDVIGAYRLLMAIARLPPNATASAGPGYAATRKILWTVGRLFQNLLEVYTSVTLTLSEQLKRLSFVAHLTMLLYAKNKGAFIPVQLYQDLQTMVKNAYFCVAKTQVDDPDGEFWIVLCGTDRLETTFGDLRTMIGNDMNMDLYQLTTRVTGATECSMILAENPTWDKGPKRITLPPLIEQGDAISGKMDHINPVSWRGDVHVAGVSLRTVWNSGRKLVEDMFPELGAAATFSRMDRDGNIDMLRPFGVLNVTGERMQPGEVAEAAVDEAPVSLSGSPPSAEPAATWTQPDSTETDDMLATAISPELEDHISINCSLTTAKPKHSLMVSIQGKDVFKASVLKAISSPFFVAGSWDRLRRVASMAKEGDQARAPTLFDEESDTGATLVTADDPVATILRSNKSLFLAIAKIISIKIDGKRVSGTALTSLRNPNTSVVVQVMQLRPKMSRASEDDSTDWKWNGRFEQFGAGRSLDLSGAAIHPINPVVGVDAAEGEVTTRSDDDYSTATYPSSANATWYFDSEELRGIAMLVMQSISQANVAVPTVADSPNFPYRDSHGEHALPPMTITAENPPGKACFVCEADGHDDLGGLDSIGCARCPNSSKTFPSGLSRITHSATHILYDSSILLPSMPCGFCLQYDCQVWLKKGRKNGALSLDMKRTRCPLQSKFSYASATTSSKQNPSTNYPLRCPLCPPVNDAPAIWRYNLYRHLTLAHPTADLDAYADLWTIQEEERADLRSVWDRRNDTQKKAPSKHATLEISEAHRAKYAYGYVPLSIIPNSVNPSQFDYSLQS